MLQTSTATAITAALIGVTLLLLPGWSLLRLWRIRGLSAWALAPACTTAMLALGAILTDLAGWVWGWGAALGAIALALALAWLIRIGVDRLPVRAPSDNTPSSSTESEPGQSGASASGSAPAQPHTPGQLEPAPTHPRLALGDRISIAGALAVVLGTTLGAIGNVDAYLQRWDAVFHLAAVRRIAETGSASSLTLGSLAYGDARPAPYPAGWHAFASLLPGSPTAQATIAALLATGIAWVLGAAVLARTLFPHQAGALGVSVAGTAAVLAAVVTISPISLWIGWGHIPNAAGLAMVPAVVAFGIRWLRGEGAHPPHRARAVLLGGAILATGLIGIALTHPNALLAAGVLLTPAVIAATWRLSRDQWQRGAHASATLAPLTLVAAGGLAVGLLAADPLMQTVAAYTEGEPLTAIEATGDVIFGRYRLWTPQESGAALAALTLVSALWAIRRRAILPVAMLALAWLLYIDAASGGAWVISRPWYTSPARISVIVAIIAVPLAASGALRIIVWVRDRLDVAGPILTPSVAATLLLAVAVPGLGVRADSIPPRFDAAPGHPPQFVTTGEIAMIADLDIPAGSTVLGNPFSGVASAYGLVGLPAVFPVANQVWSADQRTVMENLDSLAGGEAEVCDAVARLGVGYLYQDTAPYQASPRYAQLDELEVPGAVVIAQGDTARVLQLPACRP